MNRIENTYLRKQKGIKRILRVNIQMEWSTLEKGREKENT